MELIYCLKCKKKTETIDEKIVKNRISGRCKVCNSKKSQFKKISPQ